MSEQSHTSGIERRDGLQIATSMADRAIAAIYDPYEGRLSNGELYKFRSMTDVSEKVDKACWNMADPNKLNMRGKAVSLRSWHIIRLIDRRLNNLTEGEWPYWFFLTGADTWPQEVLATTDAYIPKFLATQYSVDPRPELTINKPQEGFHEKLFATIHNRALLRRQWSYPDGTPYQAAYIVKA